MHHQLDNVIAPNLQADRLFYRHRRRLVLGLLKHRCKAEELPVHRLLNHYFLLVFVHHGHLRFPRHHHVTMICGVAGLEYSLQRRKSLDLHLRRQNLNFIVV
jgi:hypothetical protein